jgi:hypothetical protein
MRFASAIRLARPLALAVCALIAVGGLVGAGGCATSKPDLRRTLVFQTTPDTNRGEPFYVLVRNTTAGEFTQETYNRSAARIVSPTKDPAVLAVLFALPGREHELVVESEEDSPVGIFALFTQPADPWKLYMDGPLGRYYEIDLQDSTASLRFQSKERPRQNRRQDGAAQKR